MVKKCGKFVPRHLTNEQKQHRRETCENMLEMVSDESEWFKKIITGDETWVYAYDPETKQQSREWCRKDDPNQRRRAFLVTFFDYKGLVHHQFFPEGQTINREVYLDVLRSLREAVRKKRPEKWRSIDWMLHHDNARPHTARSVLQFLAKNNLPVLPQAPYPPDLAPCDLFLFTKMKMELPYWPAYRSAFFVQN